MTRKILISGLIAVLTLMGAVAVVASDRERITLTRVTNPTSEAFSGPLFTTYHDASGQDWITVFKFREVAVNNDLGNFNGSWSVDEGSGDIQLTRFDTNEEWAIALFSTQGLDGYLVGYRVHDEDGKLVWHFMGPGEALPWDLDNGKYEVQIVDESARHTYLSRR